MLLLLAACTQRQDGRPNDPSVVTSSPSESTTWPYWNGPDSIVPLSSSETLLTVEEGYELTGQIVFEDFDGDEIADLLVGILGLDPENETLLQAIVLGPLDDVHVPSDAWMLVDRSTTSLWPYELTGDTHLDLLVTFDPDGWYGSAPASTWFVPHPYDGSVIPGAGWTDVGTEVLDSSQIDVDGDGTSDKVRGNVTADGEELELTWGPIERWDGPSDVIITPTCRYDAELYPYPLAVSRSYFPGDLDGDGSPEVLMASWGWVYGESACGDFTVSLPSSGVVDPFTSPLGIDGLFEPSYQPIGDWTGDGLVELLNYDNTVVVSPVVLDADGVHGSQLPIANFEIKRVIPQSFDLDDDGRPEALLMLDDEKLAVVPMDLEQLTDPTVATAWELPWGYWPTAYVDAGHAWVAMLDSVTDTTIRRIDLGPATAL